MHKKHNVGHEEQTTPGSGLPSVVNGFSFVFTQRLLATLVVLNNADTIFKNGCEEADGKAKRHPGTPTSELTDFASTIIHYLSEQVKADYVNNNSACAPNDIDRLILQAGAFLESMR